MNIHLVSFFAILVAVSATELLDWANIGPLDIFPEDLADEYPVRNPGFDQTRITGGSEAQPNEIPYQVFLLLKMNGGEAYCGGSLISNRFVLTAAHCVESVKSVTVFLGAHAINKPEPSRTEIQVHSSRITIHKDWNSKTLRNDIALIELPFTIQFTDKIQPINLPRKSQVSDSFVSRSAIASGWGKYSDGIKGISPTLRYIRTAISSQNLCQQRFSGIVQNTNICISGANGKSTCSGDSGGPLAIFESDGSRTLVGATSFGSAAGCERNFPAVFTRISSYLDWIVGITGIELKP